MKQILGLLLIVGLSKPAFGQFNEESSLPRGEGKQIREFVSIGGDKDNGGFRDSEGTGVMLNDAKISLIDEMQALLSQRNSKVYQSEICSFEIQLERLNTIISEVTYNPLEVGIPVRNLDGIKESRWFQINSNGKVEATKRFFDLFHGVFTAYYENESDLKVKGNLIKPIRTGIVHESLHLFGYNQFQAKKCVPEVIELLESYNPEKLKALKESIQKVNDQKVADWLIQVGCLTEDRLQEIKSMKWVSSDFHLFAPMRISRCISEKDQIVSAEPNATSKKWVDLYHDMIPVLLRFEKPLDLGRFLNRRIKFKFETPEPQQK